jgi:hypothetical protein
MSTVVVPSHRTTRTRRERRAERRRLRRHDVLSARLAELHAMERLLDQAVEVVDLGWAQGAWFTVSADGATRAVTAYDLRQVDIHPVSGACLVGAVVHAAGGPKTVGSQLVQRTLDLTWHVLREDLGRAVRWSPAPHTRMIRVLDLTHWNDDPERTQGEVVGLLRATRRAAGDQRRQCLAERSAVTA